MHRFSRRRRSKKASRRNRDRDRDLTIDSVEAAREVIEGDAKQLRESKSPEEIIPIGRLRDRLAELRSAASSDEKSEDTSNSSSSQRTRNIVLVSTGSFQPVHIGHVDMLETAKRAIETNTTHSPWKEARVVAGYLSPSHDWHVFGKCSHRYMPAKHRLEMCRRATESTDWIEVSSWESSRPRFEDFFQVCGAHKDFLKRQFPDDSLEVVYVCGKDHAVKCRLQRGHLPFKVVCVSRDTESSAEASLPTTEVFLFANRDSLNAPASDNELSHDQQLLHESSSTAVRDAFESGDAESVKQMVHPDVWQYLTDNELC